MDDKDQTKNTQYQDLFNILGSVALKWAIMYGVPAAIALAKTLLEDEISPEKIADLDLEKRPSEYFKCLKCVDCKGE